MTYRFLGLNRIKKVLHQNIVHTRINLSTFVHFYNYWYFELITIGIYYEKNCGKMQYRPSMNDKIGE